MLNIIRQSERFLGHVPGVQGGDVQYPQGEEGAFEEGGGGKREGVMGRGSAYAKSA